MGVIIKWLKDNFGLVLKNIKKCICSIKDYIKYKDLIPTIISENATLKKELDKYKQVERAKDGNYMLQIETNMPICPVCWSDDKFVPIYDNGEGSYKCSKCGSCNTFNFERKKQVQENFFAETNRIVAERKKYQEDHQFRSFLN